MSEPIEVQQYFVYPSLAINNDIPVNIVVLPTFNRIDKPDVRNLDENGKPKTTYCIIFSPNPVNKNGQTITWEYDDETCRDADYNSLKAKVSTTLGS